MGVILHYTDLATLRVGIPQPDGSMAGIPMESKDLEGGGRVVGLAELAGLCVAVRKGRYTISKLLDNHCPLDL